MGVATTNKGWSKTAMPAARWMCSAITLAALAACGGGGGDAAEPVDGGVREPPAQVSDEPVIIDPVPTTPAAFRAKVDAQWADPAHIEAVAGGPTAKAWNMADPKATMPPGMKVAFFGRSPECGGDLSDGPVGPGSDSLFATVATRTGVATNATTSNSRWTPTATTSRCSGTTAGRSGPHWIYLNPANQNGGVAVYTEVGPDETGRQPFLLATPASGTDGKGYNANGIATFVAFRHDWYSDRAVKPWRGSDGAVVDARVVARQSVGAMQVGSMSTGLTSQVKQQVMFTVINTTCQFRGRPGAACHVQYLFNTAAARAGVSDWATYSPANSAHIWFDKDQGALPVIDGQVPTAGQTVTDLGTGQALYRSAGNATQHKTFNNFNFDLRISFDELLGAVRVLTGRVYGVSPQAVTTAQLVEAWGEDWANPDKWTLISTTFGQEIHNSEFETRRAWIGGGFSELYAGPSR